MVMAVLFLSALFLKLRSELHSFQEEPLDNVNWNVTQLELDAFRFESQAEITMLRPEISLDEMRRRFDLFYSRAQSVLDGHMFNQTDLAEIVSPMRAVLSDFIAKTTPIIDSDDATLREMVPIVLSNAKALREDLRTMSVEVIDKYARLADQRRASFSSFVQQVAWASGILFVILVQLLALALWLNHRAEQEALQTQRVSHRLGATVDTSLDAIIVADQDGKVVGFNNAAVTIFGYSQDEAINASLSDLIVPPQHRAAHSAGMDRMKRTGEMHIVNSGRFRISAMRKGGAEFPIELSIASTEEAGGKLFVAYLRDISHRVAAEQAVIDARDEAIAAGKAKTNFMAVMSHEMRTPLNGLMAALEVASRETMDAKQAQFLALARSSAEQLLRHTNEVLDISKVDAGHLTLSEEDFSLSDAVETLVRTFTQAAEQKGTQIEVRALSTVPKLHGDSFRLVQIVQNFLSNAIKFTRNGKITVEFEVQEQSKREVTIELRVIDTGIGVAEADQERVFDDFVMIDPTYSRASGGTGLGLAISRRLAHALNGEIGVESEPGEGSCFWLRIPFRRGSTVEATPQQTTTTKPEISLDILVVEDNPTNRIVLQEMLVHQGHRVTLAVDGFEGMQAARSHRFDLILMDISMPVMDGLEATEMIRAQGLSKASRIIAVTAHSMPEDRARFEAVGMDGLLIKPISGAALAETIAGGSEIEMQAKNEDPTLDRARIDELTDAMGKAGVQRMLSQFLADLPGLVSRLAQACGDEDFERVRQIAHDGVGASAMVGAVALGSQLRRVETACRDGNLSEAVKQAQLVPDLSHALTAALNG